MDRVSELLEYVEKSAFGIEIGPYHNPTVPKRNGYRSISLDVFDADELRRRAADDPNIPQSSIGAIETVDVVGSAVDIAELVQARYGSQRFSYIVSSHNFEHLPDPIRFLQGCSELLEDGGVLSMAVPDRRFCFDYFRPATELSEWLEAYHERRRQPTPAQVFRGTHLRSSIEGIGAWLPGETRTPLPDAELADAFQAWSASTLVADADERPYVDTHCSAFTPASLELLVEDLRYLGLLDLEPIRIVGPVGCEFFIHLRKSATAAKPSTEYQARRTELLHRAAAEHIDPAIPRTAISKLAARRADVRRSALSFARRFGVTRSAVDVAKHVRDRVRTKHGGR